MRAAKGFAFQDEPASAQWAASKLTLQSGRPQMWRSAESESLLTARVPQMLTLSQVSLSSEYGTYNRGVHTYLVPRNETSRSEMITCDLTCTDTFLFFIALEPRVQ